MLDFVAEIGSTWYSRDTEVAKLHALDAIEEAAEAGATIVKFQLFRADTLYSKKRAPDHYENTKKYELPLYWLPDLSNYAHRHGVRFWVSVFSPDLADMASLYVDGLKIASGDIDNDKLIQAACYNALVRGIPIALSTGAANEKEIKHAIRRASSHHAIEGMNRPIIFHCKSIYPSYPEDMNLSAGLLWKNNYEIGLSDHTQGSLAAQIAVGMGYTIFEKHMYPIDAEDNPDMCVAISSRKLKKYINDVKLAYEAVGVPEKVVHTGEISERIWARRGDDGLRPRS